MREGRRGREEGKMEMEGKERKEEVTENKFMVCFRAVGSNKNPVRPNFHKG